MVEVNYSMSKYKITMSGHAGYGQSGNDIVCAGISTIFYNLIAVLTAYSEAYAPYELNIDGQQSGAPTERENTSSTASGSPSPRGEGKSGAFKRFEWRDGNDTNEETYVIAEPTSGVRPYIRNYLEYAVTGFVMMEKNYPEAIKVNISE